MPLTKARGNGKGMCRLCYKPIEKGGEQIVFEWYNNRLLFHLECVRKICNKKLDKPETPVALRKKNY